MDVRAALRSLWTDRATITEYEAFRRGNGSTGHRESIVLESEPCKLSFERLQATERTDAAATVLQAAKLFIDESIDIKAGSRITVTREGGRVFEFAQSGLAGIFTNHQEIPLLPFREFA